MNGKTMLILCQNTAYVVLHLLENFITSGIKNQYIFWWNAIEKDFENTLVGQIKLAMELKKF